MGGSSTRLVLLCGNTVRIRTFEWISRRSLGQFATIAGRREQLNDLPTKFGAWEQVSVGALEPTAAKLLQCYALWCVSM